MDPTVSFQRYHDLIAAEMRSVLDGRDLPLYDMLRYHLGWSDEAGNPVEAPAGKWLRPTLCLLACSAVGGNAQQAGPAAAALELLHNFSLIHDDIQDASPERRHRSTVWHIWGTAQAITAGDAMYGLARLAILKLADRDVPYDKVVQAAELIDNACLRICEGQYMDVAFEGRLDVDVSSYLEMIGLKSASLIQCAMHLGATLGTDREKVVERLRRSGWNLGMAFQIQDDILGIWGQEALTGKPSESDVLKRKKTLPVLYGLAHAEGQDQETLRRIYIQCDDHPQDVAMVPTILEKAGAREHAQGMAQEFHDKALEELEEGELDTEARKELSSIANFLITREY